MLVWYVVYVHKTKQNVQKGEQKHTKHKIEIFCMMNKTEWEDDIYVHIAS